MKTRHDEMREAVRAFHKAHPEVWTHFEQYTLSLIARGFRHYSVNAVFEHIRWTLDIPDDDGRTTFKLNNNHRPFYARRFMKKHPEHVGFFRLREQTSKAVEATHLPPLGPDDYPEVAE